MSTSGGCSDGVSDATNPQVLCAAVGAPGGDAANGIYKTSDGGGSWAVAGDLPTGATDGHIGRITIALAPSNDQTLYACLVASGAVDPGTFPTGDLYEMVKTTNAGVNWSKLASTPNYFGGYIDSEPDFFGDYDTT